MSVSFGPRASTRAFARSEAEGEIGRRFAPMRAWTRAVQRQGP